MTDELARRLKDDLRRLDLPVAPEGIHDYLDRLGQEPVDRRRNGRRRPWLLLLPAAALLVAAIALAGGSTNAPPPSVYPSVSAAAATAEPSLQASPVASFPATVDGLRVQSVSELLAARVAGQAKGGPYALRGYWSVRSVSLLGCRFVSPKPGELEDQCFDSGGGITEQDEEILKFNDETGHAIRPNGPYLRPRYLRVPSPDGPVLPPDIEALFGLPRVNDQEWPPVPIVVVGHFDDPRAADCRPKARQLCLDRFVIDRVSMFDPNSVPAPTP